MRVTQIEIRNFRSIRHLVVDLNETTVFVGPNNAGKTAILDALRIALTRRWGQRGTGFTEYDIHLTSDTDDPKSSPGVSIELHMEESESEPWPDSIVQDLVSMVQVDPATGIRSIALRARCAWREDSASFEPSWEFLNAARQPLAGAGARRVNLERFWRYLPVFYLGALRDIGDEFSPRSQFWGRLLKALEIPPGLESSVQRVLDHLNRRLLNADPRLQQIAETLSGATRIAARDRGGGLDLRMAPLKTWDLLSKAEIILRNEPDWPWLPLQRQGQGVQSLSVIFLFQAFVEHLLRELYEHDSQAGTRPGRAGDPSASRRRPARCGCTSAACRARRSSPPIRPTSCSTCRSGIYAWCAFRHQGTEVRWLPASFSATVPRLPGLNRVVAQSNGVLRYEPASQTLTVRGSARPKDLSSASRRAAARMTDRADVERDTAGSLRDRSSRYVDDGELQSLETFARRMRGEIFFAERWMIVEGQADFLIVHASGGSNSQYDLDEHGVSLIDAQNNGSPDNVRGARESSRHPVDCRVRRRRRGKEVCAGHTGARFHRFDELQNRCLLHRTGDWKRNSSLTDWGLICVKS